MSSVQPKVCPCAPSQL
jgi:hypothetical protein